MWVIFKTPCQAAADEALAAVARAQAHANPGSHGSTEPRQHDVSGITEWATNGLLRHSCRCSGRSHACVCQPRGMMEGGSCSTSCSRLPDAITDGMRCDLPRLCAHCREVGLLRDCSHAACPCGAVQNGAGDCCLQNSPSSGAPFGRSVAPRWHRTLMNARQCRSMLGSCCLLTLQMARRQPLSHIWELLA